MFDAKRRQLSLASKGSIAAVTPSSGISEELLQFAEKSATGVSLKGLLDFGSNPTENTLLRASIFLHHELPIRFAKRAVELDNLPYGLSSMSAIRQVKGWYVKSFEEVTRVRVDD